MSLLSVSCPACGASTYVSLPPGRRFVTTEPSDKERSEPTYDIVDENCDSCETTIPVVHGPSRGD